MSEITFACEPVVFGSIAEPVPAKKIIEDWFRKLPMDLPEYNILENFGRTVKACPPFLDAMTLGYMFLVPADFKIEITGNGTHFNAYWRYPEPYIDGHPPSSITGHPKHGKIIVKVFTMWGIKTKPGWSTLIFPPINRAELPLEAMAGVLDSDRMHDVLTIPCFCNLPDGLHFIRKGTPLAQVLPFKREELSMVARGETPEEKLLRENHRRLMMSEVGSYQRKIRHKGYDDKDVGHD